VAIRIASQADGAFGCSATAAVDRFLCGDTPLPSLTTSTSRRRIMAFCHANCHRRGRQTRRPEGGADELGLVAGTELEVRVVDRRLEIELPTTPMRLEQHEHGVVAVTEREMPVLTAEMVRETLERVRR
jgi:hypothetical protein